MLATRPLLNARETPAYRVAQYYKNRGVGFRRISHMKASCIVSAKEGDHAVLGVTPVGDDRSAPVVNQASSTTMRRDPPRRSAVQEEHQRGLNDGTRPRVGSCKPASLLQPTSNAVPLNNSALA